MALFNLFKPKWRHSNPAVRLQAVAALTGQDLEILKPLAVSDPDTAVRQAALNRIADRTVLAQLLTPEIATDIRKQIESHIAQLQRRTVLEAPGVDAQLTALAAIEEEFLLAELVLAEVPPEVRLAALDRIADQALLADLIGKNCGKAIALAAIEKIDDEGLLRQAAEKATSRVARTCAQQKIDAIEEERNRPDPETARQLELSKLLERARTLCSAPDTEAAMGESRQIQRRWRELAGQDHRSTVLEELCEVIRARHQERSALEAVNRAKEEERRQRLDRLRQIAAEIGALSQAVTGTEEGRATALHEEWGQLTQALGDALPEEIDRLYRQAGEEFAASRAQAAEERSSYDQLGAQLESIAALIEQLDLEQAASALAEAQRAFDGWRPTLISRQAIADRLVSLREQLRAGYSRREEAERQRRDDNWRRRQGLLVEAKALLHCEDIREVDRKFAELKSVWDAPADLPEGSIDLGPEFAAVAQQISARLAEVQKEESWRRWQNKNLKTRLVEEACALDSVNDLHQVFKTIKELQESWRGVGPAPAKEEAGLWRRFQEATERNFARCRAFFQELDAQAELNLQEKMALRDQAIACQDSTEWQKTADAIKALQAQWKKIGRAQPDKEQEVFVVFRAACDHFFERRKAYHAELDQQRQENLNRKEALCHEAEALADQPDTEHKVKYQALQKAWKEIGPVPRDQEEAIWQRFRAACDRYYGWLDSLRPENLAVKQALCVEAQVIAAGMGPETNLDQAAKKIVALQRRWKEIGPVPSEQQEEIWRQFKGYCDTVFAAKANRDEAIDRERPQNQAQKEACLARVKELISASTVTREAVREVIATQEAWQKIGPAGKESERELQQEFKRVCDTFFKERREAYQLIDIMQRDNLKKKEALCLRLELLAGVSPQATSTQQPGKKGGLTLAEQLKVAFETNFVLSAEDQRERRRRAKDEIEAVGREWHKIGPVPREHEHAIRKRYTEAMSAADKVN